MKNKAILIVIIALILVGISGFLYSQISKSNITGEVTEREKNYYTYTKAICTEDNFCQDYIIACEDNKVLDQKPITGAIVQHSLDWKDPRDSERINGLCNVSLK